jgi:hypothetical protein
MEIRYVSVLAAAVTAVLAVSGCASTHVLRDFTTDACSFFPEGNTEAPALWSDCCVSHDMAYWQGGTVDERRRADGELYDCVLTRTGSQELASRMYRGVRLGGAPLLPTTFRWGYGWGFGRGYEPVTPEERQKVAEMLAAYRAAHPGMALTTSTSRRVQKIP